LELIYSETAAPKDMGWNEDDRELAVWFAAITVCCAETGETLCAATRDDAGWRGLKVIYGLAYDGWSVGRRMCVLLNLERPSPYGYRIVFQHIVFQTAFARVRAKLSVNGKPLAELMFGEGELTVLAPTGFDFPQVFEESRPALSDAEPSPRLSILIPTRGRCELVFAAVASLESVRTSSSWRTTVLNNGPSSPELRALVDAGLPVELVELGRDRSFAEANNIGVEATDGEYLLLLNDDAFPQSGAIGALMSALIGDPDIGAAAPSYLFPSGQIQELGCTIGPGGESGQRGAGAAPFSLGAMRQDSLVDYASAACLMLRRADYLRLGGLDQRFDPAYWEDADLCLRLAAIGKQTRWVHRAVALHIQSATAESVEAEFSKARALTLNRLTFLTRWGPWLEARAPDCLPKPVQLNNESGVPKRLGGSPSAGVLLATEVVDERLLGAAGAISGLGGACIVTPAPVSRLHLERTAGAHGWSMASVDLHCLTPEYDAGDRPVVVRLSDASGAPALIDRLGPRRGRRILYWDPAALDAAAEAKVGCAAQVWAAFDALVVETPAAREALVDVFRRSDLKAPAIELIPAPIATPGESPAKERLVVSCGPLRAGGEGGGHQAALAAFRQFKANGGRDDWRFVALGPLSIQDDLDFPATLASSAGPEDCRVLVNPDPLQIRTILGRASLSIHFPSAGRADAVLGARPADAIAALCTPLVVRDGADMALCDAVGAGLSFDGFEELVEALAAGADGFGAVDASALDRLDASHGAAAVTSAWRDVLAGRARSPPVVRRPGDRGDAIVVIGMHRSGTSAMTRALSVGGAALPANLMPPLAENPEGFWESLSVMRLNDRILAAHGSAWDDVFGLGVASDTLVERWLTATRRVVRECFRSDGPVVLKDPRISLLAPLWRSALIEEGYRPRFVIMLRHPMAVAASLAARNRMPQSKGLLLWASYMLAAERDTRGAPRAVVEYDRLLRDPRAATARALQALGLVGRIDAAQPELNAVVRADLQHHRTEAPPPAPFERIGALYEALGGNIERKDARALFLRTLVWLQDLNAILGPTLAAARADPR
jgi:GT2 family glycosyltransferase